MKTVLKEFIEELERNIELIEILDEKGGYGEYPSLYTSVGTTIISQVLQMIKKIEDIKKALKF